MDDDQIYLICGSVGHVPGAQKMACTRCQAEISVAPSGVRMIDEQGAKPICIPCSLRDEEQTIMPPTADQLVELEKQGVSYEQVEAFLKQARAGRLGT